ncbi:cilia- and flagella-associated protein 47 isoform X2 [Mesocricetus auratus]|uniref:Cilia- and flagella-associated protein 47 isoform X2 n=1 Tax=Mesocricetus auratus TaxID=10036 RepID=A0ABM2XBB1_MESAU|nr:cilia- and flagella-associated protein 47 isoform X2 [Mesocricetus auratus]
MDTERGSLALRDVDSPKKEVQLRVIPSELRFLDAVSGKVYRLPLTVHNLGRWNQKMRFQEPAKPQFKLLLSSLDKELASGLQMTAMVEYRPDKNEDVFDHMFISAGNKVLEIPLIGLIPTCQLEIVPVVDFGTLVANSKVHCKEISIINHGKAPGMFKTEYQGQLPIVISPSSGTVKAKSSVVIKVDFCADQSQFVNEVARVSLQGRPDTFLNIKVHVVEQIIELFNMNSERKLECIRFGSVFFGTSKIEHALLFNNSPETINWIAIMQDDCVGEELGANIHQRTDIALNNLPYLNKIKKIDMTDFISCVPSEGTLLPYQKIVITFCFSPKLVVDVKKDIGPAYRQDYALFVRFDSVGSKDGFLRDDNSDTMKSNRLQKLELALTGSGLPVILQFDPGKVLTFAPCFMGEHSDLLCIVKNHSISLPVMYHFQKTAHFKMDPERGKIDEGCIQNVICSFVPHQIGVFKVKQVIEIIGPVADESLRSLSMKPFHYINLEFHSTCKAYTKKVGVKINPGISPLISNPTRQFVIKDSRKKEDRPPVAAMLQSAFTNLHNHRANEVSAKDALIAFPNDRAASIRCGDHHEQFRTIFTKMPRHHYMDPDYEYTDLEKLEKKIHKDYYRDYIRNLRNERLQKEAQRGRKYEFNEVDIGMQPLSGLRSPPLSQSEIEKEIPSSLKSSSLKVKRLLSTKKITSRETESLQRKILKGIKSKPTTHHEKHDCSKVLTSKQIHQVIVGPSVLNFGNICVQSTNTQLLHIVNMLPMYILIQLDIDLEELQKTKQFSYVIPPTSSTYVSMVFQSSTSGKFWKSFTFRINNIPGGHILVMAVILPVKLELSSNEIVLRPQTFSLKTCFRGTVRLYNHLNLPGQFVWKPVSALRGTAFSIRPAKGIVDPYCSLECEVTWQPGFSSPEKGEFTLQVSGGNTLTLKCIAHVGHTKVTFLEPRILFSNSSQGLTTWRKAILHNIGQNHAYFKVCDQSLLPTINIVPSEGVIPFGGITVLNISCTPTVAEKFDTRAKVAIHRANVIDLRIGGSVEIADVEITPNVFNFSGTYVGTTETISFVINNKGVTRAKVEFNLKEFPLFAMDFKGNAGEVKNTEFPYMYAIEVEESTSVECGIAFSPVEVATYNFSFPVLINSFKASELYCEYLSQKKVLMPKVSPLIPPCFVQATVLRAPVELSSTEFVFKVPLYEIQHSKEITRIQDLVLYNISKKDVQWSLDIAKIDKLFKSGIFKFTALIGCLKPNERYTISIHFCPKKPITYRGDVAIRLNDNLFDYRILSLIGEIQSPQILFDPPFICFTPVPLDITAGVDIRILPQNYFRNSTLQFKIPTAKLLDDDEIHPLTVTFPKGRVITASDTGINDVLPCHLSFNSSKPVSFFANLLFCDDKNNWFSLPVTATAENCILTIYLYLAVHLDKQKVILKDGKQGNTTKPRGSFLIPVVPRRESKHFAKKGSIVSKFYDAELTYGNLFVGMEIARDHVDSDDSISDRANAGSLENEEKNQQFFAPEEGSKAYDYFQKVVNAAQTWFSLFGWPEGPHSLSIPETIRRDVQKIQFYSASSPAKKYSRQYDFSKYNKTIYDVVLHLSGRLPPGINSNQSLPVDNTERVIQLHSQHASLLDFITAQGGCISHVLPEFLLGPEDYKKWLEITTSTKSTTLCTLKEKYSINIDMDNFEAWSTRAWTDVFLQIYKVMVLSRVTPRGYNSAPSLRGESTSKINPSFVSSNIYSNSERILLSWLNTNYESHRHVIWQNNKTDGVPSERWIVNFDVDLLDGLVFATQLAAYCPFLIETHFTSMYTRPKRSEQYLHNSLIIINSLREIGFDLNIQAIDICDPNPVLMLMLCVYMYERLPTYLPKKVVKFSCTLYDVVLGEILVKNPSLKNLVYTATIVGRDAADFSLAQTGNVVTISPKNQSLLILKFLSRFLHPAEATLLLISKPKAGAGGSTMAFALKGEVLNFKAIDILKCKAPCYQWKEVSVNVKNPFSMSGDFRVILVESTTLLYLPSQVTESSRATLMPDHSMNGDYDADRSSSHAENGLLTSIKSNFIREFFCSMHTIYLGAKGSSSLEICYLPFDMHIRYCAIILSNEAIGDLIYVIEGKGLIPLPSNFLSMKPPSPIDYSTSAEEEYNNEDPVLYLSCKPQQVLDMDLKIPLTNESKEKALAFAAQQQMSTLEYERRAITGTLESSTIRAAVALLGLTKIECLLLFNTSKLKKPKSILYATELSLPAHFSIPRKIYIPQVPEPPTIRSLEMNPQIETGDHPPQKQLPRTQAALEGTVSVPLRFAPLGPGRYPCKILLVSRYDVRVYVIEGVVNEEEPEAELLFKTPAFEPLTQHIPIKNETKKPWRIVIKIEGEWFYGPQILHVGPGETIQYPLTFKPIMECEIMGKLTLQNEVDGMEHIIEIDGIGMKPLALDHIVIDCKVGNVTAKSIIVPNYTKSLLTFKVTSDLSIVWGTSYITIEPDNSVPYTLHVCPWKRGEFTGAITFSVKSRDEEDSQEDTDQEKDISSQETPSDPSTIIFEEYSDEKVKSLKIWYHLEIHSAPGPPADTIELHCIALETVCIEIPISNPKDRIIRMDVKLTSSSLNGPEEMTLNPLECVNYIVWYSPATTGYKEESIIFQPEMGEEFWYLLKLTTDLPKAKQIPEMQCDLGKKIIQTLPLYNPTQETLELKVGNSNPENFVVDINKKIPLVLLPHSTTEISVYFHPSGLGRAGHETCINFYCTQFKEWKFHLFGVGLFPMPIDVQRVSTVLGLQASVMIHFKNPTNEDVSIDLILTNKEEPKNLVIDHCWDSFLHENAAFRFSSLRHTHGIVVPPKGTLDVPVLFIPTTMKLYKTMVIVMVKRANKENWLVDNFDELSAETKRHMGVNHGQIQAIHWMYPIIGLPQAQMPKSTPTVIKCQAKKRVEEKVEVTMTGNFFGSRLSHDVIEFAVYPKRNSINSIYEDVDVTPKRREFEYEIEFESEDLKTCLDSTVTLYLYRKHFNIKQESISLIFKLIFSPRRPFRAHATLKIECITDGIWKFPITLIATEPEVEEIIDIQGIGLFKTSVTEFRLTSQTRYYEPFTAHFLPGGDRDFFVKPQSGELPPFYTKGIVIVVGFKPRMYSKKYQATLVIQTDEIYWLYEINGLPPLPKSMIHIKAKIDATNKTYDSMPPIPHNFIRENAKLRSTGVSSTIKGAPLVKKHK